MISKKINPNLIAPCGMNCGVCIGYLRDKNKCLGCREMKKNKPNHFKNCTIAHCSFLKEKKIRFCSAICDKFPCTRLKNLDKRYKDKYKMSMLENLERIKKSGIRKFVQNEEDRWKCKNCGELLSIHRVTCLYCGRKTRPIGGKFFTP
jgi:hypothetical protein